jgi:hypothetical protein
VRTAPASATAMMDPTVSSRRLHRCPSRRRKRATNTWRRSSDRGSSIHAAGPGQPLCCELYSALKEQDRTNQSSEVRRRSRNLALLDSDRSWQWKGDHLPLSQEIYSDPAYQALGEGHGPARDRASSRTLAPGDLADGSRLMMSSGCAGCTRTSRECHPGEVEQACTQDDSGEAINIGQLDACHDSQIRCEQVEPCRFRASRSPGCLSGRVWTTRCTIVADTGRKRPLLLVTGCRPARKEAGDLIQAYLERWGAKVTTCKQWTGLERIRVCSFHAMRRLLWLAMIAVGIQALMILARGCVGLSLDRAKEGSFPRSASWRTEYGGSSRPDLRRAGGSFASGHGSVRCRVRASIAHLPALANGDSRYQAPATRSMQ